MLKTVQIYYCDRCGKKMEEGTSICCDTHPNTAIQIQFNGWQYADLCDKCKESFKAWWEKSSTNPKGEMT